MYRAPHGDGTVEKACFPQGSATLDAMRSATPGNAYRARFFGMPFEEPFVGGCAANSTDASPTGRPYMSASGTYPQGNPPFLNGWFGPMGGVPTPIAHTAFGEPFETHPTGSCGPR
jgi:hypothetical protein